MNFETSLNGEQFRRDGCAGRSETEFSRIPLLSVKLHGEGFEAVHAAVFFFVLDVRFRFDHFDGRNFGNERFEERPHDKAGMRGAKTEVGAEAKRNMRVRFPVELNRVRVGEDRFIVIR